MSAAQQERFVVESADGTPIDVWRSGRGPPLALVHGAPADHARWDVVRSRLEARFTVLAVDRRDRAAGGEKPYAFEREADDLLAVVAAAGPRCRVLGHSFGALVALDAAARSLDIERLVLYEGGFTTSDVPAWGPLADEVERLVAAGMRERALETGLGGLGGVLTDADLAAMRRSPAWKARIAVVHAFPRELRAAMRYRFSDERAARVRAPTMLLVGGESAQSEHEDAARVAKALGDARIVVLPGQGHVAMDSAPELFAGAVLPFLV